MKLNVPELAALSRQLHDEPVRVTGIVQHRADPGTITALFIVGFGLFALAWAVAELGDKRGGRR